MDLLVLIEELVDVVHNARPVPLTDHVRVEKQAIADMLGQMRTAIPEEIEQARRIANQCQDMVMEAQREAEGIVKEAHQDRLISVDEITKQAKRAADDFIEDARGREREIRSDAEDYVEEILNTLEVNLLKLIEVVQHGRGQLTGEDLHSAMTVAPV